MRLAVGRFLLQDPISERRPELGQREEEFRLGGYDELGPAAFAGGEDLLRELNRVDDREPRAAAGAGSNRKSALGHAISRPIRRKRGA